jgi:hypothetical protein
MGCGASAEVKNRLSTLETQNAELHKNVVNAEVEKQKVLTQKEGLETSFTKMERDHTSLQDQYKQLQLRLTELKVRTYSLDCNLHSKIRLDNITKDKEKAEEGLRNVESERDTLRDMSQG